MLSCGICKQEFSASQKEMLQFGKRVPSHHLGCVQTILQTDHQPLTFINVAKYKNDQITHWALAPQGYDNTVKEILGKDNVLVDYLSHFIVGPEESNILIKRGCVFT